MHLQERLTATLLRSTPPFIEALNSLGIQTVEDLLLTLPRAYEDLSTMHTLENVTEGEKVTLRGIVDDVKVIRTRQGKMLVQGIFTDADGNSCTVIWFNQPHIKRMIPEGAELVLTGKIGWTRNKLTLQSPTFERGDRGTLLHAGKLVPIYPQREVIGRISTRWLREKMALAKNAIKEFPETLPPEVLSEENFPSRAEMIEELHFPTLGVKLERARERLSFEELYALQIEALKRKKLWQEASQERLAIPMDTELIRAFFQSLKFTPTNSQKIAIYEILKDLEKPVPMSRLLEGDVGSGKTLVAVAVMANVVQAGGQCALMVPTEVLAKQHAEGIAKLLLGFHAFLERGRPASPFAPRQARGSVEESAAELRGQFRLPSIALLTGSTPPSEAEQIKLGLARGTIDIAIGTHALIQSNVRFKDLRLAIVDEQHRFGVEQRKTLKDKGSPHFLSMTATPIPRTLALTAYGDHDLSVLLEKPGNRKPIKTKVVAPMSRHTMELWMDKEIESGHQVYVICPLIKESDELADVRNVLAETKRLQEVFSKRRIALLHGKLTSEEKDSVMRNFKEKETDILVSTSVIEVGIDVPNASIILIEGAERFGLAQLHQLRGRVGRDDHQSYCFLCTSEDFQRHSNRLKAMEKFTNGFHLAEIDLKLRGPGELFGLRQSGLPEVSASSLTNPELVMRARKAAERALGIRTDEVTMKAGV